jgi:hypothetical protein
MFGEHGYFHYDYELDNYRNVEPKADRFAGQVADALAARHRWLKRRSVDFVFFAAPVKSSIYPEGVPAWAREKVGEKSLLDRVMAKCRERGVPAVDLRPALLAAKAQYGEYLYFKTDYHWSNLGAWVAYEALITRHIAPRFPNVRPIALRDYDAAYGPSQGNQARWARLNGFVPDFYDRETLLFEEPERLASVHTQTPAGVPSALTQLRDTVDVFVSGETGAPSLLLLGDSFTWPMAKLLYATFSNSAQRTVNDSRFSEAAEEMAGLVRLYRPSVVLLERIETQLTHLGKIHPAWASPVFDAVESKGVYEGLPSVPVVLRDSDLNSRVTGSRSGTGAARGPGFTVASGAHTRLQGFPSQPGGEKDSLIFRVDLEATGEATMRVLRERGGTEAPVLCTSASVTAGRQVLYFEILDAVRQPDLDLTFVCDGAPYRVEAIAAKVCPAELVVNYAVTSVGG